MNEDMRLDAMETVITALEKYNGEYDAASAMITDVMDKRYGASWHCVVGQGFGFEVTYEVQHLLYMFHGGNLCVLLYKAS